MIKQPNEMEECSWLDLRGGVSKIPIKTTYARRRVNIRGLKVSSIRAADATPSDNVDNKVWNIIKLKMNALSYLNELNDAEQ